MTEEKRNLVLKDLNVLCIVYFVDAAKVAGL